MFRKLWTRLYSLHPAQLLLCLVLVVAIALRFSALGEIPHGITWDEAAIGYNGYATAVYYRDEWLDKLPISFRSFGDFKAPFAIYLTGIFTSLFGLNPFVLRLPFAIAGFVAVVACYWLVRSIWPEKETREWYAVAAAVIIACSPWHVHFSRAGFESGLSLTVMLVGIVCWITFLKLYAQENVRKNWLYWFFFTAGVVLLSSTFYIYHSAKITTPLLTLAVTLLFIKRPVLQHWRVLTGAAALASICISLVLYDTVFGEGATRAGVLLFSQGLSTTELLIAFGHNLLVHLDPQYLVGGSVKHLRDGVGAWSILLPTTAVFFALGVIRSLYVLYRGNTAMRITRWKMMSILALVWYLTGMLPALLAQEVPHANRSLGALPGYILLALLGLEWGLTFLRGHDPSAVLRKIAIGTIVCLHVLCVTAFWQYYTTIFASDSADAFSDGYLEAFSRAEAYLDGTDGLPQVQRVIMSSQYGQPYIFALFALEMNPIAYRGGALNTYHFAGEINTGDLIRENVLVIATPEDDMLGKEPDEVILGSNGEPRFLLYLSKRVEE